MAVPGSPCTVPASGARIETAAITSSAARRESQSLVGARRRPLAPIGPARKALHKTHGLESPNGGRCRGSAERQYEREAAERLLRQVKTSKVQGAPGPAPERLLPPAPLQPRPR